MNQYSEAFLKGYSDYCNGIAKNPYRWRSYEYDQWQFGFDSAMFDDPNVKAGQDEPVKKGKRK
jgi:hypothetical protein